MKTKISNGISTVSADSTAKSTHAIDSHAEIRPPQVSIVVPTFREAANLPTLCERLFATLAARDIDAELIIVDDNSEDGTIEAVAELALSYPIRIIVREHERGLSSAVVTGFNTARAPLLVCMDADLSHPPERVPDLLAPVAAGEVDFCVGSRYVEGAGIEESWGMLRALNSNIATWLARPLTNLRDPMAGFFCTSASTFQAACENGLAPLGYKIGLEIAVRGSVQRTREVAIHFNDRHAGTSKLGLRQQIEYIVQLILLYAYRWPAAIIFASVIICAVLAGVAQIFV